MPLGLSLTGSTTFVIGISPRFGTFARRSLWPDYQVSNALDRPIERSAVKKSV